MCSPFPIFVAALVVCSGSAVALAGAVEAQAPTAVIAGLAVSADGTPVTGGQARLLELHVVEPLHEGGRFSFAGLQPGTYTVLVQRLGYRPASRRVTVGAGERAEVMIQMDPVAVELTPMVVTGTVGERRRDDVLSPTSVLSGGTLERNLQATLAATLQGVPGVTVTSIGPATGRPVLRGLSGDRVLVLEDGQRTGDMSATGGDHAQAVETVTAERVEVVRGPMSLLYGSSALGGVINVVREDIPAFVPEHIHGSLVSSLSSVNRGKSIGANLTLPLGSRIALRAEGAGRDGEDYRTPAGVLANTFTRAASAALAAGLVLNDSHYGGMYRFYDGKYGIPGGFVGGHQEGVDVEMRRHALRGEGEWHTVGGRDLELKVTGSFSDYVHFEREASGRIGTAFAQTIGALDVLATHGVWGPASLGAAGLRVQYRDIVTGGSVRTPATYDYNGALFLVEELARGPFRLQGGARFDWARYVPRDLSRSILIGGERVFVRERTFSSLSGSVGGLYELAEGVRLGVNASRAFRTPDFNELYSSGPHLAANTFDVGDPSLRAETGVGLDAFLRVTRPSYRMELAAFRNDLDDYIFPSTRGFVELGRQGRARAQYTNEGARFTGAEAELEWNPLPRVILDATAGLVRARFTTQRPPIPVFDIEGEPTFVEASRYPPLIPPATGSFGIRYEHPRWFVGTSVRAAGRQERVSEFEEVTPGYAVIGGSLGMRLVRGGQLHSITLRLDNAANKEYRNHLSRIKEIMPEPGRDVSLLYRLTF